MCWLLYSVSYSLLTRPNQVETVVQSFHFSLSVWTLSCRCHVKFSVFYVVSALQLLSLYFYFLLIKAVASSYLHKQHFVSGPLLSVFTCIVLHCIALHWSISYRRVILSWLVVSCIVSYRVVSWRGMLCCIVSYL